MSSRMSFFHAHHEAVLADGEANARRRNARSERFREAVVAPATQNRVLGPQSTVSDFERGAHVVIQAPNQAGTNFEGNAALAQMLLDDAEVRVTIFAEVIEYGRQCVDGRL